MRLGAWLFGSPDRFRSWQAAAGGLIGIMTTRRIERELANYYQQAVVNGDILVAVDQHDATEARLEQAAGILSAGGAKPLSLPEG